MEEQKPDCVPIQVPEAVRFVDDAEMAAILTDEQLIERLRAGSREARGRKGRFLPLSTTSSRS